jgi:hypothetical protein
MSQVQILVGAAPNDGNGDPIRDAFIKANLNATDAETRLTDLAKKYDFEDWDNTETYIADQDVVWFTGNPYRCIVNTLAGQSPTTTPASWEIITLTASEIKTLYESNADTNAFTDSKDSSLTSHLASTANPHGVTKDQVGLSNVNNIKTNLIGTDDPDADNDTTEGYSLGSTWMNIVTSNAFICVSNLTAAAVWIEITNLTDAEIKTAYENNADTNAYTDNEKAKVQKGLVDASLAANLPTADLDGDEWLVSVAGNFQASALIIPAGAYFEIGARIKWNVANGKWYKIETTNHQTQNGLAGSTVEVAYFTAANPSPVDNTFWIRNEGGQLFFEARVAGATKSVELA